MIIAIEGCDGSGKATQTRMLTDAINRNQSRAWAGYKPVPAYQWSFPNYISPPGALIREALTDGWFNDVHPKAAAMMYLADFAGMATQLNDYNEAFQICDRYVTSGIAYQYGRLLSEFGGKPEDFTTICDLIEDTAYGYLNVPVPDVQIMLAVPPDVCVSRCAARGTPDANERLDLLTQVDRAYGTYFNPTHQYPPTRHFDLEKPSYRVIIDGNKHHDEVHEDIIDTLNRLPGIIN